MVYALLVAMISDATTLAHLDKKVNIPPALLSCMLQARFVDFNPLAIRRSGIAGH
jgi:hypothetical protein